MTNAEKFAQWQRKNLRAELEAGLPILDRLARTSDVQLFRTVTQTWTKSRINGFFESVIESWATKAVPVAYRQYWEAADAAPSFGAFRPLILDVKKVRQKVERLFPGVRVIGSDYEWETTAGGVAITTHIEARRGPSSVRMSFDLADANGRFVTFASPLGNIGLGQTEWKSVEPAEIDQIVTSVRVEADIFLRAISDAF